jgi:uncharacterized protein YcbX
MRAGSAETCPRCGWAFPDPWTGKRRPHGEAACAAERERAEAEFDAVERREHGVRFPNLLRMQW